MSRNAFWVFCTVPTRHSCRIMLVSNLRPLQWNFQTVTVFLCRYSVNPSSLYLSYQSLNPFFFGFDHPCVQEVFAQRQSCCTVTESLHKDSDASQKTTLRHEGWNAALAIKRMRENIGELANCRDGESVSGILERIRIKLIATTVFAFMYRVILWFSWRTDGSTLLSMSLNHSALHQNNNWITTRNIVWQEPLIVSLCWFPVILYNDTACFGRTSVAFMHLLDLGCIHRITVQYVNPVWWDGRSAHWLNHLALAESSCTKLLTIRKGQSMLQTL
jgi:hypothetical protein